MPFTITTVCSSLTLKSFEGFLGWLMVKTGLREELRAAGEIPRVDAGWLCAHLGSALMIYSILLYTAMGMLQKVRKVEILCNWCINNKIAESYSASIAKSE